jgi:hypothetical protein
VSVEAIRALSLLAFKEAAGDTDGFEMRLSLFSMARTLIENEGPRDSSSRSRPAADRVCAPAMTGARS